MIIEVGDQTIEIFSFDDPAELKPTWPEIREEIERLDKNISSLFVSLLFPQNQSIEVQIDSIEFVTQVKLFKLPVEHLDVRMGGHLPTVFSIIQYVQFS